MEVGEKLYPQTGMEGRDIVRKQLEGLQNALEILFDGVTSTERELQTKLTRWSSFEETANQLAKWLTDMEKALPGEYFASIFDVFGHKVSFSFIVTFV